MFCTAAVYPLFLRLLPLFSALDLIGGKKLIGGLCLLICGLTSPLSDIFVGHHHLCQKGDLFGHHHGVRNTFLPYCLRKLSPLFQFSINRSRFSTGSQVPIIFMEFSSRSISFIAAQIQKRCGSMVSVDTCPNTFIWFTSGDRNNGSTTLIIWFFKASSTAVYFRNSAWFCRIFSVTNTCSWEFHVICGQPPGMCGRTNVNPVCAL